MPGYVEFKYRDGQISTHTKSTFHSLNVLTIIAWYNSKKCSHIYAQAYAQ